MFKKNEKGILHVDGISAVALAEEYGTPLYVYSEAAILERCEEIRQHFLQVYENTRAAYASKAFLNTYMIKLMEKQGFGLDVVSGGELYMAIKAGFPPEGIEFNGNNKSAEEIQMGLNYGIGRFIVDSREEIDLLEMLCKKSNRTAKVLYRINPGVKSKDTHAYNTTATKDAKFGIPLDEDILYPAIQKGIQAPHLNLLGLHFHVGSQIFETDTHMNATKAALDIMEQTYKRYGYAFQELNLGGGYAISYTKDEKRRPYAHYLDPIMKQIEERAKALHIKRPWVVIEPGRSIVGEAGLTLYEVGTVKEIPHTRIYVAVDGGMTDNIRPALYQAQYEADIANRMDEDKKHIVTLCGKCCESGDILIKDIPLQSAKRGDICAVYATGAYGYSMASNYNKNPIPAIVFVKEGKAVLTTRRQSYEQMIENDL